MPATAAMMAPGLPSRSAPSLCLRVTYWHNSSKIGKRELAIVFESGLMAFERGEQEDAVARAVAAIAHRGWFR